MAGAALAWSQRNGIQKPLAHFGGKFTSSTSGTGVQDRPPARARRSVLKVRPAVRRVTACTATAATLVSMAIGGDTGVYGTGANYGVYGNGSDTGVYGYGSDIGVYGNGTNYGVYGNAAGLRPSPSGCNLRRRHQRLRRQPRMVQCIRHTPEEEHRRSRSGQGTETPSLRLRPVTYHWRTGDTTKTGARVHRAGCREDPARAGRQRA